MTSQHDLCLAGTRCAGYNPTTNQPAHATRTPICDACANDATRAISQLARDHHDLDDHLAPTLGEWHYGQPHTKGSPPVPLQLNIEAIQRHIWKLATTWAEILTDIHHLADPPHQVRDTHAVRWAVGILTPRVEALARIGPTTVINYPDIDPRACPWHLSSEDEQTTYAATQLPRLARRSAVIRVSEPTGAQGVLDLTHAHARAFHALGLTSLTRQLPGYCQNVHCSRPDGLTQPNGSDTVTCSWCGHQITRDEYERYGNLFLQSQGAAA